MSTLSLFSEPLPLLAKHASSSRIAPFGQRDAKVMIVGEAPGKDEIDLGRPFVGASGRELRRMLQQADIKIEDCFLTNVFLSRPVDNKIENYCGKKGEVGGQAYPYPPLSMGKYILPELLPELQRLAEEIASIKPDLIVALGNTACWALLGQTGIGKMRGNKFITTLEGASGFSCIPTYHPAAILRQWDLRVIAVTDFLKCARFLSTGFSLPQRRLLLDPTLDEVESWLRHHVWEPWAKGTLTKLSFDIETKAETITMIGFSAGPQDALCVPFFDPRQRPAQNYWPTFQQEWSAWSMVKQVCESPIPKLGQNGLYDIQYLFRYGIKVQAYLHDTMIKHHALFPELEKGLGFMGSVYTDEAPWKLERARNKENFKQDDE